MLCVCHEEAEYLLLFIEPEMWDMMKRVQGILDEKGIPMLPEIHDHYTVQLKIAEHGYTVYDFVLPVMVLHTLYSQSSRRIRHWLSICPRDQHTTLDTHDGLGTVDVEDLLSEEELQAVIAQTESMGRILNGITVRRLWEKSGCIRLTVLIIPQWVRMTTVICCPGRFSFLRRVCRRYIIWGCWPVKMIMS